MLQDIFSKIRNQELFTRVGQFSRGFDFSNLLTIIVLLMLLVLLVGNLWIRVQQSTSDYEVYLQEVESLHELEQQRAALQEELQYYQSLEYRIVYARDAFNLAIGDQELYSLREDIELYEFLPERQSLSELVDQSGLWQVLLFEWR